MESLFEKLEIEGRLVSPEAGSPYPWVSCSRLFWPNNDTASAIIRESEVEALISVPFRGLTLRPRRRGEQGERKKENGSK